MYYNEFIDLLLENAEYLMIENNTVLTAQTFNNLIRECFELGLSVIDTNSVLNGDTSIEYFTSQLWYAFIFNN